MDGRREERGGRGGAWVVRVVGRLAPASQRDALVGDLAEAFHARRVRAGRAAAHRWLIAQAMRSAGPLLAHRVLGAWRRPRCGRRGDGTMRTWPKDLGLAVRALAKRPGFTATVAVTLALGVGANTALFGVFRAVFLEPMPLPDSEELVVVMQSGPFGCCGPASWPDFEDYVQRQRSFDAIAALRPGYFNLTGLERAERVYATAVTSEAFGFLGVEPLMGRALLPEDETTDEPSVVLLSHAFWQRALGGRPGVVGETVEIDGAPLTVVGVMPPGFDVPNPWIGTRSHAFWVPFAEGMRQPNRGNHSYPVIGRLSDGTTLESAQADMERVMRELAVEYPATNEDRSARVFTAHEYLYGDVGELLLFILGAAGVVLLVACGNVAGLQLARAAARETELAVRSALGASRGALVRLLFSESLLLAVVGGTGGVLVSYAAADGLKAVLPPTIPRIDAVRIDGTALLFALGAALLTAVVFGMLPALLASRSNLAAGVREGGYATLAPHKERLRDAFIVTQIALGLVLANGAGLLVRSYAELRDEDRGFRTAGVLTLALNAAGPRYEGRLGRLRFYERVGEEIAALPGVTHTGFVSKLPLSGGTNGNAWIEGTPPRQNGNEGPLVEVSSVAGDYFDAMGIPLLRGRTLGPADTATAAIGVVINQAFADVGWPDDDPLGKRFSFTDDPPTWLTVVGVVGTVRQWGPEQPALPEVYLPFMRGWANGGFIVARVDGEAAAVAGALRGALASVDPTQPASSILGMDDRLERAFAQRRFYTTLIGLFAVAALLLASAGIYGTVSYFVARRVRELGIRIALGAGGRGIARLVMRRAGRLAVWGVGLGLLGVWASTALVERFLYGIEGGDPLTLTAGCLVLAGVTLLASGLPAARATRVSPMMAMRAE